MYNLSFYIWEGDDGLMKFFGTRSNRGFSLVELLLVIVLIAILMALVTLSGSSMMASTDAQTEVRRLIRTTQSLRSAWLACYADTQTMIGITPLASGDPWPDKLVAQRLSQYSDRSLADEIERYGNIHVRTDLTANTRRIDIGFSPSAPSAGNGSAWDSTKKSSGTLKMMKDILANQAPDYELTVYSGVASNDVYIRIR
jgi:prepilin-type N-terminal cleavage/methylation domain-containing protein